MNLDQYVRSGHRSVRGWLRPEAASLISELGKVQSARGAVGEIGVHHGKLFLLLSLLRREGESRVAIDLFEHQESNIDHSGHGDREAFLRNIDRIDPGGDVVEVHAINSTDVTKEMLLSWSKGSLFRLFSVDGGHTAEITRSDLSLAASVLAPGGLLILDDYFNVSWPGVSEGTNRYLLDAPTVVPIGSAHGKMFFTTPDASGEVRKQIRGIGRRFGWRVRDQRFHGAPHIVCEGQSAPQRLYAAAMGTRFGPVLDKVRPFAELIQQSGPGGASSALFRR